MRYFLKDRWDRLKAKIWWWRIGPRGRLTARAVFSTPPAGEWTYCKTPSEFRERLATELKPRPPV